jgi:hypothetical protein
MSFKSVVTGNSSSAERWTELLGMAKAAVGDAQFDLVASCSMGGVYCAALVRQQVVPLLKRHEIWSTKLGANGMLANKAAVVFECTIGETSFASIVCHLSPHDQNWEQRNSQWHELVGNMSDNLDYFMFMGNLNYRIGLSYEKCIELIRDRGLAELVAHDQRQITRQSDPIIGRFYEAPIYFNPTFKFDKNSDVYDTSAKHRVPSWTDRVLVRTAPARMRIGAEDSLSIETDICQRYMAASMFKTDRFWPVTKPAKPNFPRQPRCICYRTIPSTFSDHHPVQAIYKFPIAVLARDRFDDLNDVITAKFEEMKAYSIHPLERDRLQSHFFNTLENVFYCYKKLICVLE